MASLEAGDLKGKKIGTQWRVTRAAVDAFLKGMIDANDGRSAGAACWPRWRLSAIALLAALAQDPRAQRGRQAPRATGSSLLDKHDAEAAVRDVGQAVSRAASAEAKWSRGRCERRRAAVRRASKQPHAGSARSRRRKRRNRPEGRLHDASCSAADVRDEARRAATEVAHASEREADGKWRVIGYLIADEAPGDVVSSPRRKPSAIAEVRLPGVRRRSGLESGEAEARLPVLRHRVAGASSPRDGRDRRARSRRGAARRSPTTRAAGRRTSAQVKLPELQRDLGARSRAPGAELRVLRLGAARPVRGDEARVPAGERAAVHGDRRAAGARRASARGTASCGLRRSALKRRALTDTVQRRLPAVLDVRRAGRRALDRRGRPLLLRRPKRTSRTARRARGRCSTCAGSRRPGACRISSTTTSSARRSACTRRSLRGIEPFPTQELKPYDAGYVAGWVVERYQIDLVGAAQRARAAMDAKLQALCAQQIPGDTYRNLVVRRRLFEADVQAHPGAGLAADLHVRRARVPVRDERRHRRRARRVSEEPVEDRADRPRALHHRGHRDVDRRALGVARAARSASSSSRGRGRDRRARPPSSSRDPYPHSTPIGTRAVHARGANVVRAIADQDGGFGSRRLRFARHARTASTLSSSAPARSAP